MLSEPAFLLAGVPRSTTQRSARQVAEALHIADAGLRTRWPVIEIGLLLAGDVDPADARKQLARWAKAGRVYRLGRALYALAPPFQKIKPHPFVVANRMARGSYVSRQSALAQYSLVPEYVPVVTSVTTPGPGSWDAPLVAISLPQATQGTGLEEEQYQKVEEFPLRYPPGQLFGSQDGRAYQVVLEADLPWQQS